MRCFKCNKDIKGGFLQKNGTHSCGDCAIYSVEVNSLVHTMNTLLNKLDELNSSTVNGRKYKEKLLETKKGLREVAHLIEFSLKYSSILKSGISEIPSVEIT
jgi:hypothetical protein